MRADASELELQLYGTPAEKEVAGPVRDVAVRFTLRASGLPALDRNVFSKDSSDPYFVLKARDGNGFLHLLGKSKVISKNLNPEWEPVEVSAAALGSYRTVHVQIWDHDIALDDDQIGVVDLELPQDLGAALGEEGAPPLEKTFSIPAHPLTGPLAELFEGGIGTLEGSYTLVEGGAAAPAAAKKKKGIFGRKPITSPPPSPPAELEASQISELEASLACLRKEEAVLHGEVVRLKTGGMLECREAVAVACRTVAEDEKRKAEEEAAKKAAKKKGGEKKKGVGVVDRLKKGLSLKKRLMQSVDDLVHDALDDLGGVGDDFDEEAGRGGIGSSEVIPVDMSDETLAWPRFVPVIRLIRRRTRSDCCSWADKNAQAFYTVKYQQEVAECEVQREDVVSSPREVHEKLCVHYQAQLMRGWPHAKIMTQFSDMGCGLVVLWKRCRKFTGGYSEAKLKVRACAPTCAWGRVHVHACISCVVCMFSTGPGCNPMHPCFNACAPLSSLRGRATYSYWWPSSRCCYGTSSPTTARSHSEMCWAPWWWPTSPGWRAPLSLQPEHRAAPYIPEAATPMQPGLHPHAPRLAPHVHALRIPVATPPAGKRTLHPSARQDPAARALRAERQEGEGEDRRGGAEERHAQVRRQGVRAYPFGQAS